MESFRKKFGLKTTGAQNGQSSSSEAEPGSTKGKLMSTWYNMKYGKTLFSLDANTSFSTQSPVWLLGQCYHRKLRQSLDYEQQVQKLNVVDSGITSFYEDFSSKIWFTYRRNFEDFKGTNINTDCGWGCMIRSGQMLLANALLVHKLGRGWRWKLPTNQVCTAEDVYDELTHRDIVRVFGDSSNTSVTPLSIHNMMEIANSSLNRQPGDWFGPTSTAHIIKQSVAKSQCHELLQCLRVYVAKDSTVYKGDIYSLCMEAREQIKGSSSYDSLINIDEYSILDPNEILVPQLNSQQFENENSVPYLLPDCDKISVENERNVCCSPVIGPYRPQHRRSLSVPGTNQQTWTPVLILIPVKLGRDHKLNPIYSPCLKSLLSVDSCVGVIGGKPKHSLFFVGFQEDNLIHLDPHLAQERVDIFKPDFDLDSFHSKSPRKLHISKMDPSCCFGFLLDTEAQFEGWCKLAKELAVPPERGHQNYPIFSIVDGKSIDHLILEQDGCEEVLSDMQQLDSIDESGIDATLVIPHSDEDDFVFL